MKKEYPTVKELNELFEYKDGSLFYKTKVSKKIMKGQIAGSIKAQGYWMTTINYRQYYNHRLIFLMHHGFLPKNIDHKDGNKLNNRIENLRPATTSENGHNSKIYSTNTSGVKNVNWSKSQNKWIVRIKIDYKTKFIGYFKDLESAKLASIKARKEYCGDFAKHH